jgi:hypothetical protein
MELPEEATRNRRSSRGAVTKRPSDLRITERDKWILEGLAKMRFLTTSQLAKLYFTDSRWSANKRLRKLLDADLVKVWVRNLSQDNVYSLNRKGLDVFAEQQADLNQAVSIARELDGNLDHLLAINDVRVVLAGGLAPVGGEILWWKSDWELRSSNREKLIPDAVFKIRWAKGAEQTYALELDNHTKSPRNFLKKVIGYATNKYRHDNVNGSTDLIILVVGKDSKWLERYRSATGATGIKMSMWFTSLEEFKTKKFADAIWQAKNAAEKYSLRELSFYPYGKEGRTNDNGVFQTI